MDISAFGRWLIFIGLVIVIMGGLLLWADRGLPPGLTWLGRLPGDITLKGKNFTFYFPLATGLLLSVLLSLIAYLFMRR